MHCNNVAVQMHAKTNDHGDSYIMLIINRGQGKYVVNRERRKILLANSGREDRCERYSHDNYGRCHHEHENE